MLMNTIECFLHLPFLIDQLHVPINYLILPGIVKISFIVYMKDNFFQIFQFQHKIKKLGMQFGTQHGKCFKFLK